MNIVGMAVAAVAALAVSSCGGKRGENAACQASPSEYEADLSGRPGIVSQQDRTFICQAAYDELAEVTFGRLAAQRAEGPAVKDFARQRVGDLGNAGSHLYQLAKQQAGITLPTQLDAAHRAVRDRLSTLSGGTFDGAYLQYETQSVAAMIPIYLNEISTGSEPTVQRYAANMLPILRQHLETAQRLGGGAPGSFDEAPITPPPRR